MFCATVVKFLSTSRRRLWAAGLLLCIGAASVFVIISQPGDSIEWLVKSPVQRRWISFAGPWTQPVRMQLSRLKQWILGPKQLISINAMIFELSPATVSELASRANAVTNNAGARAFVTRENANWFRHALLNSVSLQGPTNKLLSSPMMTTADGTRAQMASYETVSVGTSTNVQKGHAGWWIDIWPRASGRSTDLACFLTQTERVFEHVNPSDEEVANMSFIRTNVSLGARVRIPENGSLFLLSPAVRTNGSVLGIVLSATVQKRPGR